MYLQREIENDVLQGAANFPVVTVTGPRQSGKTTMLKNIFPQKIYISLENPDNYELAKSDPRNFLESNKTGVILDEIQRVPQLLSYIQEIVDEQNIPGQFILTGSQQFNLLSSITQSLAGRTALYKLFPFSFKELGNLNETSINQSICKGFYPRVWDMNLLPSKVYADYIETYIERDLRQLINIKELDKFRIFLRLCAGRTGQIFIASHLANEIGVSVHTINSWISILETSFVIFKLNPFYTNINKRLIKSYKIYFYDTGLASTLLRIQNSEQLDYHPLRGALFENLVVAEVIKSQNNRGFMDNFFFYRDSNQNEVDLLLDNVISYDVIEIKSSETFNTSLVKGLNYFRQLFPGKTRNSILCYVGKNEMNYLEHKLINYKNISELIRQF